MLNFEEFFTKKKINLSALKSADLELYSEFKAHYDAMGEKSFDHSKKFWFNKLRKHYLLADSAAVPKESHLLDTRPKAVPIVDQVAVPIDVTSKVIIQQSVSEKPKVSDSAKEPTGFKPRFKAGVTKKPEQVEPEKAIDSATAAIPTEETSKGTDKAVVEASSKPAGFKPRFKAAVTKMPEQADPEKATDSAGASVPTEEISKGADKAVVEASSKTTGFKPRFKAGVTKMPEQADPEKTTDSSGAAIPTEETSKGTDKAVVEASSKPTGFKPRFKAGVTKNTPPTDNKEQ